MELKIGLGKLVMDQLVTLDGQSLPSGSRGGYPREGYSDKTVADQCSGVGAAPGDLTEADGTRRERDAPGRGQGVENRSGSVPKIAIPTDPRLFQRWLTSEGCWTAWPIPLSNLATRAGWALKARTEPDWMDPANRPERDKHRANWSAFTTAYAQHVGGRA